MLVEIVDCADVESRGRPSGGAVGRTECNCGGLVENFAADRQLLRDLPLQQATDIPIIAINCIIAVVDPVAAAAIARPIAEAFLDPNWKIGSGIAGAETELSFPVGSSISG